MSKAAKATAGFLTGVAIAFAVILVIVLVGTGKDVKHAVVGAPATTTTTAPNAPQVNEAATTAAKAACNDWYQIEQVQANINSATAAGSTDTVAGVQNVSNWMSDGQTQADTAALDPQYEPIKDAYVTYMTTADVPQSVVSDACKQLGFNE